MAAVLAGPKAEATEGNLAEDTATECSGIDPSLTTPSHWELNPLGDADALHAQVEPAGVYVVEVTSRFAHLKSVWFLTPIVTLDGDLAVDFWAPGDAFLDQLQTTYVADTVARIYQEIPGGGRVLVATAPPLYLAWPQGSDTPPRVLTSDALFDVAPNGILGGSPDGLPLPADPDVRVLPPIKVPDTETPESEL